MTLEALKILKEVDLRRVERQAESLVTLAILGDEPWPTRLASAIAGAHGPGLYDPWLRVGSLAPPDPYGRPSPTVALIVVRADERPGQAMPDGAHLAPPGVKRVLARVVETSGGQPPPDTWTPPGFSASVTLASEAKPELAACILAPAILQAAGELQEGADLALARNIPALRNAYARRLTETVARANAIFSATSAAAAYVPLLGVPATASDMVVLTKNQLLMAYRIVLAAGMSGQPRDLVAEIVGVVGAGFFFRQIARELVGLIPVIGLPAQVVVAYSGTRIVGEVVRSWAIDHHRLSAAELRSVSAGAAAAGRAFARNLRPPRGGVRRPLRRPSRQLPPQPPAVATSDPDRADRPDEATPI